MFYSIELPSEDPEKPPREIFPKTISLMIAMMQSSSISWSYSQSNNQKVDFCIWILQWDGLRVPPFNSHPEGNKRLRELGVNAQTWSSWFTKVIATQNPHLLGCATEQEKQVRLERILASNRRADAMMAKSSLLPLFKHDFDEQAYRNYVEKRLENSVQEYQEAAARAYPFCRRCEPPNIWEGNAEVEKLLWQLWEEYQFIPKKSLNRNTLSNSSSGLRPLRIFQNLAKNIASLSSHYWFFQSVQPYTKKVPKLEIFLVDYPAPVIVLSPPGSAVVSFANIEMNTPAYYQQIVQIVKDLSERSN